MEVDAPLVICGDVHGQYGDLLDIFDKIGWPPAKRFLFMGDYVDRGRQSIEVICLLFYLKIKFHTDVYLLRGNHETGEINAVHGFRDECIRTYDVYVWDLFLEAFRHLPLVAVVSSRIVCMHGGISPHLKELADVKRLVLPFEVPNIGLACDLLWSDPTPISKPNCRGFVPNELRKTSFWFCQDAVEAFLERNGLDLIVRGHEMFHEGHAFHFDKKVLTIFSAPQYCGFSNDAAVLDVNEKLGCRVLVFHFERPPPKYPPSSTTHICDNSTDKLKSTGAEPWNEITLREPVLPHSEPRSEICEIVPRRKRPQKDSTAEDDVIKKKFSQGEFELVLSDTPSPTIPMAPKTAPEKSALKEAKKASKQQ